MNIRLLIIMLTITIFVTINSAEIGEVVKEYPNGKKLIRYQVPPSPPPEELMPVVELPDQSRTANFLDEFPSFDWCYGCSATSAAMIAAYWDTHGYPETYTGTTNSGNMPLNNSIWGSGECPLSATHQGIDGQLFRGNVDDYWIDYGNTDPDPYIQNGWTEHEWSGCTADFMGTNQSYWSNCDGSTTFYWWNDGTPMYDYTDCEYGQDPRRDGCHGFREFFESRGYQIETNFTQTISGYEGNSQGYSYQDFINEIDNGNPVIIQVEGHSMVGFGYDTSNQSVYIKDTWDYSTHSMTWGGNYSEMEHYAVTVCRLEPVETIDYHVSIEEYECNTGEEVVVAVSTSEILSEDGIIAYQFQLNYDDTILEFIGYDCENTLSEGGITTYNNVDGELAVAYMTSSELEGSGILINLEFEAIEAGYTDLLLSDIFYNTDEVTDVTDGSITVWNLPTEYSLNLTEESGQHGETISVDAVTSSITMADGIISYQFHVSYNPLIAEYAGCIIENTISEGGIITDNDTNGEISIAYMTTSYLSGTGTLLQLQFTGIEAGYSDLILSDCYYNSTTVSDLTNGSITYSAIPPEYSLGLTEESGQHGETITVDAITSSITMADGIISYQFHVSYNPLIAEYAGCIIENTISEGGIITDNNTNGEISIAYMTTSYLSGTGTLLQLQFTGIEEGYTDLILSDCYYNTTAVTDLTDGSYTCFNNINYPEWTINPPSYEYSFSMWGVVMLEDVQVDVMTGMLGCFVGDECRGVCTQANGTIIDYTNIPQFGHIAFTPMIYSNQTSGETISFRYFEAESEEVYEIPETVEFVADTQIGNGLEPFVWHATDEIEINKEFVPGWNWFSLNVSTDDMSIDTVLVSIGDNAVNIKNQTHNALYYEGMGWFGSLTELGTSSLYKMEVTNPVTFTFEGMPVNVSEQIYDLYYGWNWISYAPQLPEEINYALGTLANGANIKNQFHNALYYEGMGWFGSLNTLEPLAGYMLEMNEAEQLVYPEPDTGVRIVETVNCFSVKEASWQVNPHDFEYNSVVNTQIVMEFNNDPVNYELALFCDDDCRGIAEILDYSEPFGGTFHSMMVYSNQREAENMHFLIYDKVNGKIINPEVSIICQADKTYGDFLDPVTIMLPNITEEEVLSSYLCDIYPNPFNPETRISFQLAKVEHVKIEVYNIKGQKEAVLLDEQISAGSHTVVWNAQDQNSGIYFLNFSAGNQHDVKKLVLIK